MSNKFKFINGRLHKLIFTPYITKGGVRRYPKNARVFAFWVPVE